MITRPDPLIATAILPILPETWKSLVNDMTDAGKYVEERETRDLSDGGPKVETNHSD